MPPRSRGRSKASKSRAGEVRSSSKSVTLDDSRQSDFLTRVISLAAYPILLLILILLHVIYYAAFKISSNARYLSGCVLAVDREGSLLSWLVSPSKAADRHAERGLRAMAEANALHDDKMTMLLKTAGRSAKLVRMPRHVGLAIGAKPMRWRSLLPRSLLGSRLASGSALRLHSEKQQFVLDNLGSALRCCQIAGIAELTVFDEQGYLIATYNDGRLAELVRTISINVRIGRASVGLERQKSTLITAPDASTFQFIDLHILGPDDGKQAIANAANILRVEGKGRPVNEKSIDSALKQMGHPDEPDLLILHGGVRQVSTLHGFPPWLVRLCELYHDRDAAHYEPLTIHTFYKAVNVYMRAEQRFGK